MKTLVGIIGPTDIVERTQLIAEEFSELETRDLSYESETEAPGILARQESFINVALFTGPVPYYMANASQSRVPATYISFSGSSLYRTLLDLTLRGRSIKRLSIDTIEERAIEEIYNGLGVDMSALQMFEYHGPVTVDQLVAFHQDARAKGATEAITCLRSAHFRMLDSGLDSWRVLPDESAIREALTRTVVEGRASRSRDAELVIILIKIDEFEGIIRTAGTEYGIQRMRLDLQRVLLEYAEEKEITVHTIGDDEFMLVSTRRTAEEATDFWTRSPLLETIRKRMKLRVSLGMGLGPTAAVAQTSARIALHYASQRGGNCAYAVIDARDIMGPIGASDALEYSLRTENQMLRALASRTGLSAATVDKLVSYAGSRSFQPITAAELARALGVTARSGRRLIARLVACDLAESVGEEQPFKRGRPRQTYKLKMQNVK